MLDLSKVAAQIVEMASKLQSSRAERQERVAAAGEQLRTVDYAILQKKIAKSRTTWLAAGLTENPVNVYNPPPLPENYYVLATDGSQIDIDRHHSARCFLINIGTIKLMYGDRPYAELKSEPKLYSGDTEMVIAGGSRNQEQVIESNLLGIKRAVDECAQLAQLASGLPSGSTALALLDGSLILWGLAGREYPEFVVRSLLDEGMLKHLDALKKLNETGRTAAASYISYPRGNDVINALRVAVCPHEVVDTDKYCQTCESRECDRLSGIQDRDLFEDLLETGQRSAVFRSNSSITARYGEHRVYFFYLKLEEEIARIELPEWTVENTASLGLTHSMLLDQCRKGQGYPVALSEAHEQAVVTGADRESFWEFVDSEMIEKKIVSTGSAKSRSKRSRAI